MFCLLIFLAAVALPAAGQTSSSSNPQLRDSANQSLDIPAVPPAAASAEELEQMADKLRERKAYPEATEYYEAAIKKHGGESAALRNKMGMAELLMLHLDNARKEFERAIKLDGNYPEAYNNLGVVWYEKRKYKRAIRQYEHALKLREESASFHSNLGSAYFARKDYEKANREYARALELDPDVFDRRSPAGISALLMSQEDRAKFNFVLARMYARRANFERALECLRKALEEGYSKIDDVYTDSEFAQLRKDPRFALLMSSKPPVIPQ